MKKLLLPLLIFLCTLPCFSQLPVEGFENPSPTGPLPLSWSLPTGNWAIFEKNTPSTVGSSQSWGTNIFATGIQYQGTSCASVSREGIGAGNTSEDYLAMPLVAPPLNGFLRFFSRTFTSGNQGTLYQIKVAPSWASQTDPNAYSLIHQWTESDFNANAAYNAYQEYIVDLTPYYGQSIYIAFVKVYTQPDQNIGGDRWLIDNVAVQSTNDCNYPVNLHADYTSYTTLNFSWNDSTSSNWEVLVLPCSSPAPSPSTPGVPVTSSPYLFTGLTPETCYTTYIRNFCNSTIVSPWYVITPILPVIGKFVLNAFLDTNNNGVRDSGEFGFDFGNFSSIMNNTGSPTFYGSSTGNYTIPHPIPLATYDFTYNIDADYAPYYALGTFNFDDVPTPDINQTQILNFPIIQTQDYSDLFIDLFSYHNPKPGNVDHDRLVLRKYGITDTPSGIITYTKAPNTTINNVSPSAGVTMTPTGFTYTFSNLDQSLAFSIDTDIPPIPNVNINDVLQSTAMVSITTGTDAIASNNSFVLNQTVVAAFDPNEITESHGNKIQFDQFSQNDYLYYTIHFQNTGTANTSTVRVENTLDSRIDESTISMVSYSHNYTLQRTNNNLVWNFNNIILTPVATNEAQSQGYIQYKVKLKPGFAIGDVIPNTASIYFDANPAITTNTFNTEFVQALANTTFSTDTISLYPNPTNDRVTINNNGTEKISKLSIYDVTGKRIYTLNENSLDVITIDVSRFAKGIYLVELTSDNNSKLTKKLIIK